VGSVMCLRASFRTRHLVTGSLPRAVIWRARGVPPLTADGALFPPALAELHQPLARTAFAVWDRADGDPTHTSVRNWASLDDRMNFAVNVLRSLQQDPSLFESPFTPALGEALDAVLQRGRLTLSVVRKIHMLARVAPPTPWRGGVR
jgi:hypothetical protein